MEFRQSMKKFLRNLITWSVALAALLFSPTAFAKSGGGLGGSLGMSKPLEVKGQNRALSMMQVGQNEKTKIGFVQPRKNFRPQILSTNY